MNNELQILMKNITKLRKENNLTKKEMAQIMKVGVGSINKIENGELPLRLKAKVVLYLANHFSVIPSSLFDDNFKIKDE